MSFPSPSQTEAPAQELDFDQPVVNIGSNPENDIPITGAGVLPFHAMVLQQDGIFQLVPLAEDAGIYVDGQRVSTQGISLPENQQIQIGSYMLAFRRNVTPTSLHVLVAKVGADGSPAPVGPTSDTESAILVNVLTRAGNVAVDQTATYQIEVVNAGPIVAGFLVKLQGVPNEWVEINPRTFNLNEQRKMTVTIKVTPPHSPTSTAGKHPLTIQVSSPNYYRSQVTIPVDLTIDPYYHFKLGNLSPRQQNISYRKRTGLTKLPVSNLGNGDADFNITALDDENGCSFDFHISDELQLNKQASFNIPAGQTVTLPILISPLKRSFFAMTSKRYQFTTTVNVAQQPVTPQIVSGSVTSYPLFGWWSLVLGILLLVVLLFIALIPRINSFDVVAGKDVIALNDTTSLEWSVSPFAFGLNISGITQTINYGQTSLGIAPKQSTTYELTASNYLSGLVGLNQKKSLSVLVVPPAPVINVFEVDNTAVARGKAVNIRYSVTQADTANLTIGGVVTALTPDKLSGEQAVVINKDTLITLQANSASGSELRSYLINAVEPKVTVNTFAVYVRPQNTTGATSMTPSAAVKAVAGLSDLQLMALPLPNRALPSNTPPAAASADSFTEKLVELVPDKTSDSGYRVQFDLPNRQLAKGEQVMIEWSVDGTDTQSVQIAPFTDILPSKGRQPFFPQASMNFVMSAQSGDLKKLFMLPVVVFDGTPPVAPTISIFSASPTTMVGSGTVQFAWSVSGAWTRINLANGKGIVGDYLNPQDFKKVRVTGSDTFILTAWNGSLSSAVPLTITVNPSLISTPIRITDFYPKTGKYLTGDHISVTVDFPSLPVTTPPTPAPTGNVIISDGVASCTFALPVKTCDLTFITPGIKTLVASYVGDKLYAQSDSDPYTGAPYTINVTAATVNMTPTYFTLGPGNTPGTNIVDITHPATPLQLDSGLYISVAVKPVGTVIPQNAPRYPDIAVNHVRISICNQDGAGNVLISTCYLISQSPVEVAADGGSGLATIILPNFPKDIVVVGKHAFLFEYRNDNNTLLPATLTQNNITVNKMKIGLSLGLCTSDPINFNGCVVTGTNTIASPVVFDIIKPDGTPLSIDLPQPEALFSVYDDGGTGGNHPWTCTVLQKVTNAGGNYQLSCNPLLTNFTVTVHFSFNGASSTNYYAWTGQPSSFSLLRKTPTTVSLDSFTSPQVGMLFTLTSPSGGLVHLLDASHHVPNGVASSTLHLTFSDPSFIGVANASAGNCTASGGVITIVSLSSTCRIYFAKTGSVDVTLSFDGDANLAPSAAPAQAVTVSAQTAISATWMYQAPSSPNYNSWDLTTIKPNQQYSIEILLTGPSGFAPESLNAQSLHVPFTLTKGAGSCNGLSGTLNTPVANDVTIGVLGPVYGGSFTWNCSPTGMKFTLGSLLIGDGSSFSFASGQDTPKTLVTADNPTATMTVTMTRVADLDPTLSGTSMQTLYAGEKYSLAFTVGPLAADAFADSTSYPTIQSVMDYYQATAAVQISLPASLQSQIDWSNSTCPSSLKVPLSGTPVVLNAYGFPETGQGIHLIQVNNNPCILAFNLSSPYDDITSAGEQASFSLEPSPLIAPNHNNTITYTARQDYSWNGLQRQPVSATFDPPKFLVGPPPGIAESGTVGQTPDTITMTLTGAISGSSHTPLVATTPYANQINLQFPSTACGSVLTPGSITPSASTATAVLHYSSACGPTPLPMSMTYLGNAWFKPVTGNATILINNAPGTTTLLSANHSTINYNASITFTAHVTINGGGLPGGGTVQFIDGSTPLGNLVPIDTSGNASLTLPSLSAPPGPTTPSLSAGPHTITASYTTDKPLSYGSSSDTTNVTVNPAATTTNLSSDPVPTSWTSGGSVTFTAKVTPNSLPSGFIPTGTIDLVDSGPAIPVTIASGLTLDNTGSVSYAAPSLGTGRHTITAQFNGSGNYADSTSNRLTQNLSLPLSYNLTSSQNSYAYGATETYTVSLSYSGPAPSGPVTLWQKLGTNSAVSIGSADASTAVANQIVFQPTPLAYATTPYSVYATFVPDSPYTTTSTSNTLNIQITKTPTTVSLSPSATSINYGSSVTFTVTTTGVGSGTATIFADGSGTPLDTVTISAGTGTSVAITSLSVGAHQITGHFNPSDSTDYSSSDTGSAVTVTVNQIPTSVTLISSIATTHYGDSITFTATPSGAAAGTVKFYDGATQIGTTQTYSGSAVGVSITSLTAYPVNDHSITATFTPTDSNYATSNSNAVTQTVNPAPTTITITPSTNPNNYGSLSYTISVSTTAAAGLLTNVAGSAAFTDNNVGFGSGANISSAGTGGFTVNALLGVAGSPHPIAATYTPTDLNLSGSTSNTVSQSVQAVTPTVTAHSTLNPSGYGSAVTFSASLAPTDATGSVEFFDGATSLGSFGVSGGTATATSITTLTAGSHNITATYTSNTSNYNSASSPTLVQVVNKATTSTSLSSSLHPSHWGDGVQFTATITPSTLPGQVEFFDGATSLGTATVSAGTAVSTTFSNLSVGTHSITATFTPTDTVNYSNSTSSALSQVVNKAVTTVSVALTTGTNPSNPGDTLAFTATVTPNTLPGTVEFFDGASSLGTAAVSAGTAVSANITTLSDGSHNITAVFTPTDTTDYATATSSILVQKVKITTTFSAFTVTAAHNPPDHGDKIDIKVTVTGSTASPVPYGTVKFRIYDSTNALKFTETITITTGGTGNSLVFEVPNSGPNDGNVKLNPAGTWTITTDFTPADSSTFMPVSNDASDTTGAAAWPTITSN